ncbi:DEAD/DEAH box helicase [Thermogladius sp. 4427co]|uniref:DEAD/DEAH box helicase n=1 Tax=Thermogladius sp. 4427co TaxID=3450718 RepID=UPI003F79B0A4
MEAAKCLQGLGYKEFTDLQKEAFKKISKGGFNVVITAPTGSGKTEAAILPVFYKLALSGGEPISCVYITPLRALNRDIASRISRIAECFGLTVALRHGDTPYRIRRAIQQNPPQILVTTPETFTYIIVNREMLPRLKNIKYIILDELQELVESKRGLLLFTLIYLLLNRLGVKPVIIGLTATLSDENLVKEIITSLNRLPTEVVSYAGGKEVEIETVIPECDRECHKSAKYVEDERLSSRLEYIISKIRESRGVLVFTNTRTMAEYLGNLLKTVAEKEGYDISIGVHHGSLSREHREDIERKFKEGIVKAVVATSSLELGIDIGSVDLVIQYLSPRQASRLLQRVGRSGHRLGGVSRGIVISTSNLFHYLESLVLARRAKAGDLEKPRFYTSPLDVLSYAIAVYTMIEHEGVNINQLYATLVQSALFKDLSFNDFIDVLEYLQYNRIISIVSDTIRPTKKTRLYIYKTSMIPSTREISVIDVNTGNRIGSLDEDYVVLNIQQGDFLILAGSMWKVISYDSDEAKLYVEKTEIPVGEAVLPFWEGENIPVEYEVAREVGSVIRRIKKGLLDGLVDSYRLDRRRVNYEIIGLFGDDKTIVVDYIKPLRTIVVNIYGGSRLNLMIKDLILFNIRKKYPLANVRAYSTPYLIVLRASNIEPETLHREVASILSSLYKYVSEEALSEIARESKTLLWRIYQVAQRFGAISPETEKVTNAMLQAFIDTVIGREALREVLYKDYDIRVARQLSSLIERGVVSVEKRISEEVNGFHKELLEYIEIPLISGIVFDREAYVARLYSRRITLLCLNCGYTMTGRVLDFANMKEFKCPRCGHATLTIVKSPSVDRELELVRKLRKNEKLTSEENKMLDELSRRAVLLYRFGRDALLALSARGVGSIEAARILNKALRGEDILEEIYESEKRFLLIKDIIDKER